MASPFAQHLPHFAIDMPAGMSTEVAAAPATEPAPVVDPVARAEERGREQGRDEAKLAFDLEKEELEAAFAERLEEQKRAWMEETANDMRTMLDAAMASLEANLSENVAAVLIPFIDDAVLEKSLSDLSATVRSIAGEEGPARLEFTGPARLIDRLRHLMGDAIDTAEFRIDEDNREVRVRVDDTALATRLTQWRDGLAATLPETKDV